MKFEVAPELIELIGDGFTGTPAPETVDVQKLFKDLERELALEELGVDPEAYADAGGDAFAKAHSVEGVAAMAKATNPWIRAKIADNALAKARAEASRPGPSAPTLREEIRALPSTMLAEVKGLNSVKSYLGRVSKGAYEPTANVLETLAGMYAKLRRLLTADECAQVEKGIRAADVTLIGHVLGAALERAA
jgi:hypothetical protein